MAHYQYAYQKDTLNIARAVGRGLPISSKQSVEICKLIRYKSIAKARRLLEETIALKQPLPFTRYVNGFGHKPGMGPGRYVPTAAKNILFTINAAVKNAEVKNLGADLIIVHACAHRAARAPHYGRQSGQKEKRTHVEIVVAPRAEKRKEATITQHPQKKTTSRSAAAPIVAPVSTSAHALTSGAHAAHAKTQPR